MAHAIAAEAGDSSFTASEMVSNEGRVVRVVVTAVALASLAQVIYLYRGANRDAGAAVFSALAYGGSATAALLALIDSLLPAGAVFMSVALVRFSALFPTPLESSDFAAGIRLRRLRVASLEPSLVWGSATALAVVAVVMTVVNTHAIRFFTPFLVAAVLASFVLVLTNIRVAYRIAGEDGRRKMVWVLEGLVALVGIMAIAVVLEIVEMMSNGGSAHNWFALATLAAFGALLVCLMIAMFFSGAFDPELAIRRTAVYGVLGIALVFVFSGVESAVQDYLRRWLPLSDSMSGIITGGTVALSIEPLKERISKPAERIVVRTGIAPERQPTHHQ